MAVWPPANHENPPLPPFSKGGVGGFRVFFNEAGIPQGYLLVYD
jgi:hypothetical protein